MKAEAYLRTVGLPYACPRVNHRKAPKGKLPYIEDRGNAIADSTFIVDYPKAAYGDPLDARLSARGLAIQRVLAENLYWAMVYARWIDPAGFAPVREASFGRLPGPLRLALPWFARRGIRARLYGHGLGRHSQDEIYTIGCRDVDALADLLGGQPYVLGEEPSALDASA